MASKAGKQAANAVVKIAKEGEKVVYPKEKTIFQLVNGLRYFGVGSKVTRTIYKFPETYWILTKVILSKDQMHGSIWGRMVWRGKSKPVNERIGRALKPDWKLVGLPNYKHFKASPTEIEEIITTSSEPYISEEEFEKMTITTEIKDINMQQ